MHLTYSYLTAALLTGQRNHHINAGHSNQHTGHRQNQHYLKQIIGRLNEF